MERVARCQHQIWDISKQVVLNKGSVVLDLGFTTKEQRSTFVAEAKKLDVIADIHYLNTPLNIRRQRVTKRNSDKDPALYAFEVTNQMFEFLESRFESPDEIELKNGKVIEIVESTCL